MIQLVVVVLSFVRLFNFVRYCGQRSSLLWTPALRPCSGPMRLPREMCVRDVRGKRVKTVEPSFYVHHVRRNILW